MKTPVHKISIVNSTGTWLDITNVGSDKSVPIGVESIQMNKTKDDYAQECVITIKSKYDLNSVAEIGGGNFTFVNQLPTNHENIFETDGYDNRYGHFDYEVGDMAYVQFGYNEESRAPEGFFGFVKSVRVNNSKTVVITLQNQAYLLKKSLYNFSQKELKIEDLYKLIVRDYNNTFNEIYGGVLNELDSRNNTELAALLDESGFIDLDNLIINVSYTMKNYRAENASGTDILDMIREKYFTRTNFFQFNGGKTYLLGGFFNLLSLQKEALPKDLRDYLDLKFVFKNYDLKYERFGLNDGAIETAIRGQKGSILTDENFFQYNFVLNKSLTWQEEKDVKIIVNFKVSNRSNSEFKEVSYGDDGGEAKTVVYYESKTDKELKELAEEYATNFKYTGYKKGSTITTFGYPTANVFDEVFVVEVYQNQSADAKTPYVLIVQKYNIEGVNLKYDSDGIKQTVNLGQLLLSNIKGTRSDASETVFKAKTTTYTKPLPLGELPPVQSDPTFVDDSTDYQILNQIDIDIDNMKGHTLEISVLYNNWLNDTEKLKNLVEKQGLIDLSIGYFTNTIGESEPDFSSVDFIGVPNAFVTQSNVKEKKELRDSVTDTYNKIVETESSLGKTVTNGRKDIDEAKARGLDVSEREQTFLDLIPESQKALAKAEKVRNFNNKI